jgi:hypothetical protein
MKKYKNIILIIIIFAIAFIGYTLLFGKDRNEAVLSSESTGEMSVVEGDLVSLLIELRSVKLDDSIFSNPAFRSLRDFSQELVPEPVGRRNPFAPLGIELNTEPVIPNQEQ